MTSTTDTAHLTGAERTMLGYALDLAQEQIYSRGDEFSSEDRAAIKLLRGMTAVSSSGRAALLHETADAGLRDRIRRAVCEAEGFAWDPGMLEPDEYGEVADAVLAVLRAATLRELEQLYRPNTTPSRPEPRRVAEESTVTPPPALTEEGRLRAQVEVLRQDAERDRGLAKVGARCMREGHQGLIEKGRIVIEGWRFALSTALDLGTGAPWEAIHERVKELRRVAAEECSVEAWDVPDARPGTTDHTLLQRVAAEEQPAQTGTEAAGGS